jgi:excisionase family DNA binding protein
MAREFYTPGQVAEMLQVSPATVRRWIREGQLPAQRVGPRLYRIRREDVAPNLIRQAAADGRRELAEGLRQLNQEILRRRKGELLPDSTGFMRAERERMSGREAG